MDPVPNSKTLGSEFQNLLFRCVFTVFREGRCRLVQAKRNVLKKVVSRAGETPTFDEDFLDTKLEPPKKVSKKQLKNHGKMIPKWLLKWRYGYNLFPLF